MNWHNLKTRQCPKCDCPLQEGQYDYLCTTCDFKIKHYRYDEIVSQPVSNYKPYNFLDDLERIKEKEYLTLTLVNPPSNQYQISNGVIKVSIWAKSKRCKWKDNESFIYDDIYEVIDYINQNTPNVEAIETAKEEHETALNSILDRLHKR